MTRAPLDLHTHGLASWDHAHDGGDNYHDHDPAREREAAQRRVAQKRARRVAQRSAILPTRPSVSPTLEIVEIEGHGRAFEIYERGEYLGTWDGRTGAGYNREAEDWSGPTLAQRFGGRLALVYGYDAYEAACAERIEADPEDWDCSDVVPAPFLVMVRPPTDLMAELEQAVSKARREAEGRNRDHEDEG